jgi:hypothetical protein
MGHDVFISYSQNDKSIADATVAWLEGKGIRCWIAPRDILPGAEWAASIVEAVRAARLIVLIFSTSARSSRPIEREVGLAANAGKVIIPMRVENVPLGDTFEYYLGTFHGLDAFPHPLEHLESLATRIHQILG